MTRHDGAETPLDHADAAPTRRGSGEVMRFHHTGVK